MANESLRNIIAQIAATQPVSSPSIGQAAIDATNILKQQEMARQLSPEQQLLRKTKEAMQTALSTGNKDLAKKMYEQYQLPGETPDFDFLQPAPGKEPESAVAFGGMVYKGPQALMSQFAGFMDQIDTPEEAEQADQWFVQQGGSITSDPHYKEAGMPSIDTSVVETDGRKVLINKKTGQVIKDLGAVTPKGPGVSVNVGEKISPYQKKRQEKTAEWVNDTYDQGRKAYSQMQTLDELENIVNDPNVEQGGWFAKAKGSLSKIMGTKIGGKVNLLEALSVKMRGPDRLETVGPGPVSEAEQKLWSKIAPTIENTKEANLKLIEFTKALAQRKIDYSKELRRLEREGVPPLELQSKMEDWVDSQENALEGIFGEEQAVEGQTPGRKVVRTGMSNGRKVIQYDDGSVEYAE